MDPGSDGTSSRRALTVTYNDAGKAAGLPTALFTKSTATFTSRLLIGLTGIMQGESVFYTHIRPELTLRSPRAFRAAAFDPVTYRSIVLLDDLTADGWTFPDPLTTVVERAGAEDMVTEMAAYHAHLWGSLRLTTEFRELRTSERFQIDLNRRIGFDKRSPSD